MSSYVPLWCKSNFSFLEGASHPDELVDEACRLGLPALALTDRDGVYGVVRGHLKAREAGLKLIIGSEVSVDDGSTIVLLAQDRAGYANLCRLITKGRRRSEKGESAVNWEEVCAHAPGLIALWGREASSVVPVKTGIQTNDKTGKKLNLDSRLRGNDEKQTGRGFAEGQMAADAIIGTLRDAFGDRLYGMIARHRCADEVEREVQWREQARRFGIPIAAANEVLYHNPSRRHLQDVLTAIRHGVPVAACGRKLKANAEYGLKPPFAFAKLFGDDPAALERTLEIAERCNFSLNEIHYRYPSEQLPNGMTSAQWLRRQTLNGARWRYGDSIPETVAAQLEKELEIIEALDYPGYFLTMWEIVEFCRAHGILCQGRGSAANSVVCYCLGVTAIDPMRMGLLFERFISKERAE
ncbi:MAG TPA: PHP domain-containing protein, partial [Candidatus Binatus sp.]|nr:PHP domain-containing protein [Candidatus Binatus sp.]